MDGELSVIELQNNKDLKSGIVYTAVSANPSQQPYPSWVQYSLPPLAVLVSQANSPDLSCFLILTGLPSVVSLWKLIAVVTQLHRVE